MLSINTDGLKKLSWGVAGCGRFAETSILPALNLALRAKVVSLYSRDINRAKQLADKFGVPHAYNNFEEMLKSPIEAIYIAGNNASHYEQVIAAAKAGKHILCEKPIAIDSIKAQEMVDTCKKHNVLFAVDYPMRYNTLVQKAAELLHNQTIGKLVTINAQFGINIPPDDNYRFVKELAGGGALWDLGTHIIDLFRCIAGEITEISGETLNLHYKTEVDDFTYANVKFANSGVGYFNVSFCTKKAGNRLEITGTNGSILIENMYGPRTGLAKMHINLDGERKKVFRKRSNHFQRLVRAVNTSFIKGATPMITGEDGLINIRLMEQLNKK